MNIWRSINASSSRSEGTSHRRSASRHDTRTARVTSTLSAAVIALMLVLGTGAAYGDDTDPGTGDATTTTEPAPADPSTETPAEPAAEEPAEEPAAEEPAAEEPAAEEPSDSGSDSEGSADGDSDAPEGDAPASPDAAEGAPVTSTKVKSLAKLVSTPLINALTISCLPSSPEIGGFEIDGDTCVESGLDWDTTGQSVVDGFDDNTTFTGGTSEGDDPAGWTLGGPSPNAKSDIETAWAYSHVSNGTVFGYFAITNDSTAGGTGQYDVEYNQADPDSDGMPVRTPGDLLFRFSSTGSDPIVFTDAKIWRLQSDPDWSDATCEDITATAGWCTIPIPPASFAQQTNADGTFFEGSINISLFFGSGDCSGNFGVVNIRSVTGNSFYTSALKDYVTPIGVDTPSTCGKIIINKDDQDGNPLAGATFSVSPNPDPSADNADPYSITDNDSKDQNPADGVIEIAPVDPNESYTVTETDAPDGYLIADPASQGPTLVGPSQTIEFTFVDHKQWDPLTISKTATPSFAASYEWDVVKEIAASPNGPWFANTTANAPLIKKIAEGAVGGGNLYYRVTVTEGAETTTDYQVAGNIHVGNPNDEGVEATLGDSLPGGTCTIAGNEVPYQVTVPAGGADYAYVCDLGDDPAPADITGQKTNTATVTWDKSDYPQENDDLSDPGNNVEQDTADYEFTDPTSTEDESVTVEDDKTDALDGTSYTWTAEGTVHTSDVYSTTSTVTAGSCTAVIENTVSVIGDNDDVLATDSAYGQICVGSNLTITRIDAETLTRTYPWSVEKSTDTPKVYVKDGEAKADYEVIVTAGDGVDSAWNITGTITVHNPNDWEAVDVTSLPVSYTGGGNCAVTGEAFPVSIPASGSHGFNYSCNFNSQPDYNGTINATVNWDAAAASTPDGSVNDGVAITEADWSKTLVNDTVVVHDDNATPGDTSDDKTWNLEWSTVYGQPNHQEVITYTVTLSGDQLPELGECDDRVNTVSVTGDNDVVLDADNNSENNSATVEVCNPYTQISALKVDYETGEPLAGAEFTLYAGDSDQGAVLDTAISGADGIAVFDVKLLPGTYTVKETKAPPGYDLPVGNEGTVTITIDHILDPDSNFVENGVMPPITFRDPSTGQIAILSKQHFERDPGTNDWVESDGAVDFGNEIRYVVNIQATGPKLFHDVTVTDYVPGFNPADTTSTGDGVLEAASATCSGDFTCTAVEDVATGLITWKLTTTGQDPGVVRGDATGAVEFVVRMPALPTDPPYVDGVYSQLLWNQAYLDWDQAIFAPAPELLARTVAQALLLPMEHHSLSSNEVTDEARAFEPAPPIVDPPIVDPPVPGSTPLPNTGGPYVWLPLLGLGLALGGMALVLSDRRNRRRS